MTPVHSVTVQIVTYNSAEDITDCLDAVLKQTYPIDQILVIDNASKDGTADRVSSYIKDLGQPRVQFVPNLSNSGFAPAHNQGIRMTQSDYVLVLNPDVELGAEYVERIVKLMDRHREVGSATGLLLLKSSPDIVDSTGLLMNGIWRAVDRGAGEPATKWGESGEVFGVSGAAAVYRRAMIEEISMQGEFFDEDFFAYKEDVDVAWRANLLGWKAYYCADALATHARGWKKGSRNQQPLAIRRYSYINRYKMIYKNLSGSHWVKHLPKLLAFEIASNAYMLLREPKVLGAWTGFIQQLPELRKKRREIMKGRKSKS
ncbi:glycosyltransferase family 2 protein [Paenibacillus sp. MBLB2552]|uniref:Glycosyltransferase family 2 protein n=1 Tax=Paenibacillus mellifer TaxID=2937794 RepID=A0A9X1Y0P4_9BACL|nr:glycosyltransferase family 2 protein [Paenibacillus mellifer]MCK8489225.1 glycosyltransferase family 2 protein [Paenibacillus mellifer]